jgi:hypothetical protein
MIPKQHKPKGMKMVDKAFWEKSGANKHLRIVKITSPKGQEIF